MHIVHVMSKRSWLTTFRNNLIFYLHALRVGILGWWWWVLGGGGWLGDGAVLVHGGGQRASPPTPTGGAGGCWIMFLVDVSTTSTTAAAAPSLVLSHTPTVTAPLNTRTRAKNYQPYHCFHWTFVKYFWRFLHSFSSINSVSSHTIFIIFLSIYNVQW